MRLSTIKLQYNNGLCTIHTPRLELQKHCKESYYSCILHPHCFGISVIFFILITLMEDRVRKCLSKDTFSVNKKHRSIIRFFMNFICTVSRQYNPIFIKKRYCLAYAFGNRMTDCCSVTILTHEK